MNTRHSRKRSSGKVKESQSPQNSPDEFEQRKRRKVTIIDFNQIDPSNKYFQEENGNFNQDEMEVVDQFIDELNTSNLSTFSHEELQVLRPQILKLLKDDEIPSLPRKSSSKNSKLSSKISDELFNLQVIVLPRNVSTVNTTPLPCTSSSNPVITSSSNTPPLSSSSSNLLTTTTAPPTMLFRCQLCQEEVLSSHQGSISTLPCLHRFHHACIKSYFIQQASTNQQSLKCPICHEIIPFPTTSTTTLSTTTTTATTIIPPEEPNFLVLNDLLPPISSTINASNIEKTDQEILQDLTIRIQHVQTWDIMTTVVMRLIIFYLIGSILSGLLIGISLGYYLSWKALTYMISRFLGVNSGAFLLLAMGFTQKTVQPTPLGLPLPLPYLFLRRCIQLIGVILFGYSLTNHQFSGPIFENAMLSTCFLILTSFLSYLPNRRVQDIFMIGLTVGNYYCTYFVFQPEFIWQYYLCGLGESFYLFFNVTKF
jgi:hypothetical protein